MRCHRCFRRGLMGLGCFVLLLALTYYVVKDNIHVVIPGEIYRSAQLPEHKFAELIRTKHIRSVLNLRGANQRHAWYQHEMALMHALGVKHEDIRMHAHALPQPGQVQQLIDAIERLPRPLLVHCRGGADRTGMASAVALIVVEDAPLAVAEKQFSWRYLVTSSTSVGKLLFAQYQSWLTQRKYAHDRAHFLQWVALRRSHTAPTAQKSRNSDLNAPGQHTAQHVVA